MREKWFTVALVAVMLVILIGVVPTSAAPSENVVYVVRRGDTLYSIARRYGVSAWTIANYNGITNPNRIYVGQRLIIPSAAPPASTGSVHVVRRGETLIAIALRYGVSAWDIARANGITNLNYIYVGQRLVIPGRAPVAPVQPRPRPVQPTTWPGPWTGEYFDNVSLSNGPYLTREDQTINFNWAWGPPAGGMPTNNFSVRWTSTFHFDEGTYRFYTQVDDGVRIIVDDEVIIDSWRDGGFRLYSKDRAMWAGDHTVRVEYYERSQVSRIHFWWKPISWTSPTATPYPWGYVTPVPGSGWWAEFYNDQGLSGDPVVTRHDAHIGFDWGSGSPVDGVWADHFSARWTTSTRLQTDHYEFCARSDDGVRIWVGGDLILDQWHANDGRTNCVNHWFATGNYQVKVEYYEDGGNALIYVWWGPH
jgi:LysM repeat protein